MYEPVWMRPTTTEGVSRALVEGRGRARVVAGATDMAVLISRRIERPDVLVDLGLIERLSVIEERDGAMFVGATATHAALTECGLVRDRAAVLSEACRRVGSPQIRSRGTIGGNVANASPAADGSAALLALDAAALIIGPDGSRRETPLCSFFTGPGKSTLGPNEFIEGFRVSLPPVAAKSLYVKAGQRNALAIAVASVAVVFDPSGGRVSIALGSVAPTPVRAMEAERLFADEWGTGASSEELLDAVAAKAVDATSCIDDVRATAEHRRRLVRALAGRALKAVCIE